MREENCNFPTSNIWTDLLWKPSHFYKIKKPELIKVLVTYGVGLGREH